MLASLNDACWSNFSIQVSELTLASLREAPKNGMVKKSRKPGQQVQATVRAADSKSGGESDGQVQCVDQGQYLIFIL